jgi:hypothetical protein
MNITQFNPKDSNHLKEVRQFLKYGTCSLNSVIESDLTEKEYFSTMIQVVENLARLYIDSQLAPPTATNPHQTNTTHDNSFIREQLDVFSAALTQQVDDLVIQAIVNRVGHKVDLNDSDVINKLQCFTRHDINVFVFDNEPLIEIYQPSFSVENVNGSTLYKAFIDYKEY